MRCTPHVWEPVLKMGLSRMEQANCFKSAENGDFCLDFLTSVALGIGGSFLFSIEKEKTNLHLPLKIINGEVHRYLSISLIRQMFKLFVCSYFSSALWESKCP